ncbi:MAG: hypothetical protein DSM106950_24430 [Stigonema ocellatum SAG 48.90 = DSM 106950]|nr:hypothetical protein [Stigonema ocellatum SAG 48.90 = DSM 106950]
MRRVFADSSVLIAGVGSRSLLSLNTKDFTPKVAAQSDLIIQTPADFVREIRGIIERGLQ